MRSQSQGSKQKTHGDQETVEQNLSASHQRSKKKNEEGSENEEKMKKKKARKDERLSRNETGR